MPPRMIARETLEMDPTERYLDLLKGCLTRTLDGFGETYLPVLPRIGGAGSTGRSSRCAATSSAGTCR
jgi:hypothetical protein